MQVLSVGNRSRRLESIAGWQAGDSAVLWSQERGGGRASLSQIWHPGKRIRALSFWRREMLWKYLGVSLFRSRAVAKDFEVWRDTERCGEWQKERKSRRLLLNGRLKQQELATATSWKPVFRCGHTNTNLYLTQTPWQFAEILHCEHCIWFIFSL